MAAITVHAQDLYLSWEGKKLDSVKTIWGEPKADEFVFSAMVHNATATSMLIKVRRTEVSVLDSTTNYIYWGTTYPSDVDEPDSTVFVLASGSTDTSWFSAYYNPNNKIGTSLVEYTFFNVNNEEQNVKILVKYWASPEGVSDHPFSAGNFSNIYPNPASRTVSIDYSLSPAAQLAQLKIFNLFGNVVKEARLERGAGKLSVNISDLKGGIYFYAIIVNGHVLKTKKLIIQH